MKVLVVGHTYIAPINREKWTLFANHFPDVDLRVLIPKRWPTTLFSHESGNLLSYKSKNCEFISIDTFMSGNEVLYGYHFLKLIKLLRVFKPDLIHVEQGDNAFCYFQLIVLSKIFCRKAKFVFFSWVNWKNKWSLKYRMIWSFIEKFNIKNSDGALLGSSQAEKILKDKKFKGATKVLLQLGVNKKYFFPTLRKDDQSNLNIGFVGRLLRKKGIFYLVDAFKKIKNEYSLWNLIFVGDGKDKQALINYVRDNSLSSRIKILNSVKHEEVGEIFKKFNIFVLPSYDSAGWREQFGHVLIEAMACKVPIIGSTGGFIPNVVGQAGLIFEQRNVDDLTNKLTTLMSDSDLRENFSLKGYRRFQNNFSYEIIAKKTYDFWMFILQNSRSVLCLGLLLLGLDMLV